MPMADVSVIVPCFNSEHTLSRAIQSVLNQTLQPHEIIIVDDGSTSTTHLDKYLLPIYHISNIKIIKLNKNMGASHARNVGISASNSSYIAFLDADDCWHPRKIEIQFSFTVNLGHKISAHRYIPNLSQKNLTAGRIIKCSTISYRKLLFKNYLATPTVMALKSDFILFDEVLHRMEDHKCWIENTLHHPALFIEASLAGGFKQPLGASGLSKNIPAMHESAMKVFQLLKEDKKISLSEYLLASNFEKFKYLFRKFRISLN